MSIDNKIRAAIQTISGVANDDKVNLILANVDSVDEAKRTCVVTSLNGKGQTTIENVQLMADVEDGILLIPSVDSTVIVSYSTYNQPYISLFSKLEKVLLVAGENNASVQIDEDGLLLEIADTKLLISDGLTQFNDGSLGGLVKVINLTQKLNNLENKVNSLLSAYNAHTHILTLSTGTGTAAPTTSSVPGTLTPTQRGDIENEKVKQ